MKFLIVDDDPACRELLKALLSRYAYCDLAVDGEEALVLFKDAIAKNQPYDLVCLDIMMPMLDGHQTLDRLRRLEYEAGIRGSDGTKVIMATAVDDTKQCVACFTEGCECYCTKPLDPHHFVEQVRQLLGELPERVPSSESKPQAGPSSASADFEGRILRFLVVDDDRVCRELMREMLEPYGQCTLAHNGPEAIDAMRLALEDDTLYDLVVLDIMMPGTSGHDVLKTIRMLEQEKGIQGNEGVKVIMATAVDDTKQCIACFADGCESYCTKPVDAEKFIQQVREVLGGLPAPTKPTAASTAVPTAPPAPSANADTTAPAPDPAEAKTKRFLIVDDDRVCRELMRSMLEPYGQCTFAYDGSEAIDAVRLSLEDKTPYDLITLDIMMPGTSGHDALKAIRCLEAEHGITGADSVNVVMTTALRDSKHCLQSFKEGCECYVTKPVSETELIEKVRSLGLIEPAPATK